MAQVIDKHSHDFLYFPRKIIDKGIFPSLQLNSHFIGKSVILRSILRNIEDSFNGM